MGFPSTILNHYKRITSISTRQTRSRQPPPARHSLVARSKRIGHQYRASLSSTSCGRPHAHDLRMNRPLLTANVPTTPPPYREQTSGRDTGVHRTSLTSRIGRLEATCSRRADAGLHRLFSVACPPRRAHGAARRGLPLAVNRHDVGLGGMKKAGRKTRIPKECDRNEAGRPVRQTAGRRPESGRRHSRIAPG